MDPESTTTTEGQEPEVNQHTAQDAQEATTGDAITDPEVLAKELAEARKEAARYRTERRDASERVTALEGQIQGIAKALGLESDQPDPNALTSELENVRSQLRQERLTNKFTSIATAANADTELTLAYLSHRGQLSGLDPDAPDFEKQLTQAVKTALEANPKLRQDGAPGRGGAEFGNGNSDGSTRSMNDLIRGAVKRS